MSPSVPNIEREYGVSGPGGSGMVAVIEDDRTTRDLLVDLLEDIGFSVRSYGGAIDYLSADFDREPSCILLNVRLPGMSGLELQDKLREARSTSMVVFMTAFADVSMCLRAMKAGAFDFLQKPFREQEVLDTVCRADRAHHQRLQVAQTVAITDGRLNSLTAREREVLAGVIDGLLNKQIAGVLGISEIMVKVHRGNLMRKMQARTLTDLIKQLSVHPLWQLQPGTTRQGLVARLQNSTLHPVHVHALLA